MSASPLKASIIMPTYRRGHTIGRAVESIRAQTYPNWELIISNNGEDVYTFDDERIRIIDSRETPGASFARNKGIPQATGDIVGFFDDDDEMEPDYLQSFVDVFEGSETVKMAKCHMIHRGVLNVNYGTPTVMMRREYVQPLWQPVGRHDILYYETILGLHGFSEEAGTLRIIPRPLLRCHNDPDGGLRGGTF